MMRKIAIVLAAALAFAGPVAAQSPNDIVRWRRQAQNVTIIRDDWGIAHIYGKSDADAVFGALYAQAEDDFNRVETNYINAIGRLAEAEGDSVIYKDLRMKLFIDPDSMKAKYAASPASLKRLMIAFADGLNYYLYKHPEVRPRVITHFEPWMALTFSEGSIGGDIEKVNLRALANFYGGDSGQRFSYSEPVREPGGSNGFAIAPKNTVNHHALLLINPHTTFFFRSELQMVSDEGLDAYGAVTWGQFFVYQGFNDRAGWMHTSSNADAVDDYLETVVRKGDRLFYKYGNGERPFTTKRIRVPYRTANGMAYKDFTVFYSHHGPVIRSENGKWVSIRLMEEPVKALTQSFTRTKAKDYASFRKTMELHTNSSNNTVFADARGNIAYFHGNFIPRRDPRFDWTQPVDGSNPATEWRALLSIDESPNLLNPASGWLYNSNDAPWWAAGPSSRKRESFPSYVENGGQSARGVHAVRVLQNKKDFTLASLIAAAYDTYLPLFAEMIPTLIDAYDKLSSNDPLKSKLAEPVKALRNWDYRWSLNSIPTSVAVFWGESLNRSDTAGLGKARMLIDQYLLTRATPQQKLEALDRAVATLERNFGTWNTPWGEINRFQRVNGDIVQPFNDNLPSIPVAFPSARWGSLASFAARAYPGTKKWYGTSGNSFVAAVEFGDRVRAFAVTAGGESGHPSSPHFNDEATRYATGNLREVYFYPSQLKGHTERQYHP
ncbi:MAG TPA: penicillin acylase family protein [Gemmatimonadaceae bacterium]|nr:penicillin acylase family protein [Gemmatimonadaceae bacterium]